MTKVIAWLPTFRRRLADGMSTLCRRVSAAHSAHPCLYLLWCFLLPAFLMTLVHAIYGVYPFGTNSVLVLDLNGQYVYFFEGLREMVWGDASPLYSFSRNLGGEFVGIYAYYLASPLSYIVCLFPKRMILEALFLMFVLKCGLSGLTAAIFLHRTVKTKPLTNLIFSSCYALSGYAMIMQHNTMWTDCAILLPLVCLGVHSLIRERKYKLFVISLSVAILSNYYIGYMLCLFLVLYFFYAYFSQSPTERNTDGKRFAFLRALARMGIFSLMAVLIACLLILPAYYSLQFGKNSFSDPNFTFTSKFDFFDLFGALLFNSYDTVRPEGLPILYSGMLTLLLLPFYFLSRKIPVRQRLASALLVFAMLISFSIWYLDLIWHGFQAPNWLNYRYSFMLIFLLCVMAARAFETLRGMRGRVFALVGGILILLILLAQTFDYKSLDDFAGVYPNIALIVVYLALLYLLFTSRRFRRQVIRVLLVGLVSIELFVGAFLNLYHLDCDVVISNRASHLDYLVKWQALIDQIQTDDTDFYRMELTDHQKTNESYALHYYGLSGSTSTLNSDVIAFLAEVGISSRSHWSLYCSASPVTDSFLGLRYILIDSKNGNKMPSIYEAIYDDGLISAYRNPYALPIAFAVDPMISTVTFREQDKDAKEEDTRTDYSKTYSPFARLNIMMRCMLGSTESLRIYNPIQTTKSYKNLSVYPAGTHRLYSAKDPNEEASVTFTLTGDGEHEVYAHFPSVYLRTCYYRVNGEFRDWILTGSTDGFINLGVIPKGEQLTFEIVLKNDENRMYLAGGDTGTYYFYYFDEENFVNTMENLADGGLVLTNHTADSFEGTLTVKDGKTAILTTIPYDRGWKVTVDGKETETYETLDTLLTFDASEGEHTITMRYMPDEYVLGFRLCVIGSTAFLLTVAAELVWKRILRPRLISPKATVLTTETEKE